MAVRRAIKSSSSSASSCTRATAWTRSFEARIPAGRRLEEGKHAGGYWKGPLGEGGNPIDITSTMTVQQALDAVERATQVSPLLELRLGARLLSPCRDPRTQTPETGEWLGLRQLLESQWHERQRLQGSRDSGSQPVDEKPGTVPQAAEAMVFSRKWICADSIVARRSMWRRSRLVDPFAIFHGKISSISYADGHPEAHSWVRQSSSNRYRFGEWEGEFLLGGGNANNRDFAWVYQRAYKHRNWTSLAVVLNNRAQSSPPLGRCPFAGRD